MLTRGTVIPSKTGRERAAGLCWAAALVATLLALALALAPTCLASPASAPAPAQPSAGAPLSIEDNPTGYAGALQVASTGVYQMGARAYSPAEGRFLTYDLCQPTQNRYAYTGGDPVNRVDPTGCSWTWAGALKFFENPITQWVLTGLMVVSGGLEFAAARDLVGAEFWKQMAPALLNVASGAMGTALLLNNHWHFMSTKAEESWTIANTVVGAAAIVATPIQMLWARRALAGAADESAQGVVRPGDEARATTPLLRNGSRVVGRPAGAPPPSLSELVDILQPPRSKSAAELSRANSCLAYALAVCKVVLSSEGADSVSRMPWAMHPWVLEQMSARWLNTRGDYFGFRLLDRMGDVTLQGDVGEGERVTRDLGDALTRENARVAIVMIGQGGRLHAVPVIEMEGSLWIVDPQKWWRPLTTDFASLAINVKGNPASLWFYVPKDPTKLWFPPSLTTLRETHG